jgi:hypothetical protein
MLYSIAIVLYLYWSFHMLLVKIVSLFTVLSFLSACSTIDLKQYDLSDLAIKKSTLAVVCKTPRPEICTREYRPVCGLKKNEAEAKTATYANSCVACSDINVEGYELNSCD